MSVCLTETWLVFQRALRLSLRNKVWLIIGLMQPILYLALFGPLLKRIAGYPGFPRGSSWQVFTPGLLVQLGIFGALFVGFGLIAEVRDGVIERMRVTPASRMALLAGACLRDAVVLLVQSTVLLAAAYAFGLRAPLGGVILAVLLVAAVGAAFAAASYALALLTGSEDAHGADHQQPRAPAAPALGHPAADDPGARLAAHGLQRQPGQAHRRCAAGAVPRPGDHEHGGRRPARGGGADRGRDGLRHAHVPAGLDDRWVLPWTRCPLSRAGPRRTSRLRPPTAWKNV